MDKVAAAWFAKQAMSLPSLSFSHPFILKVGAGSFLVLMAPLTIISQQLRTDAASVSMQELLKESEHREIISILANNYQVASQANNHRYTNINGFILKGLKGQDAINELNKRMGSNGISPEGIAELAAIFRQKLFEALVEMLVSKSAAGYTGEDFDRVNGEIAPFHLRLQDFGIHAPEGYKKQKRHLIEHSA